MKFAQFALVCLPALVSTAAQASHVTCTVEVINAQNQVVASQSQNSPEFESLPGTYPTTGTQASVDGYICKGGGTLISGGSPFNQTLSLQLPSGDLVFPADELSNSSDGLGVKYNKWSAQQAEREQISCHCAIGAQN